MEICGYDILVAGGGPSGVTAALAAARMGLRVALVGNRPVLGGNSSSEVRIWTRGAVGGGNLFAEEMGLWGELKLRNLHVNREGNVIFWDDVLLDAVLAEENITLYLNTHALSLTLEDGRVARVEAVQLGSERRLAFDAKYYIDCTGDGSLAAMAGVPYAVGQEARAEYGEAHAPAERSSATLSSTITFYTRREDHPVRYVAPRYAYGMEEIARLIHRGGRVVNERLTGSDYWWFEYGGLLDTIRDAQEIDLELKRLVFGVWNYIKNSGLYPAENLTLEWVGNIAGKRESRRMRADHVLTRQEVTAPAGFPDAAFYGGWFLDSHPPEGMRSGEDSCTQIPVRAYPVPLRCLFHRAVPNLLFAGRSIGVTHAAFVSTRIMNTCALSGQAAGTLAAYSALHGLTPAEAAASHAEAIQTRLAHDDLQLPGQSGAEPGDIAPEATVTASSSYELRDEGRRAALPLTAPVFLCMPQPWGVAMGGYTLLADADTARTLRIQLYADDQPSRLVEGEPLGEVECYLEEGRGKPLTISLPAAMADRFVVAVLPETPGVSLHAAPFAPTGLLMGYRQSMNHLYPRVVNGPSGIYRPQRVINGRNRPHAGPNLWIAGWEREPWLQLEWPEERRIDSLRLYLNPDLSRELPSSFAARWDESHNMARELGVPSPLLAREFRLFARREGRWEEVAHLAENWRRVVEIPFDPPLQASAIKLAFTPDRAAPAQVFELRVMETTKTSQGERSTP